MTVKEKKIFYKSMPTPCLAWWPQLVGQIIGLDNTVIKEEKNYQDWDKCPHCGELKINHGNPSNQN